MKRNTTKILILFIILIIINNSCINDGMTKCLENNIELDFYLYQNSRENIFNHINSVDVFVFNNDSLFITGKRVERSEMEKSGFAGTYLSLLPGKYLIACWANIDGSTEVSNMQECMTSLDKSYVSMSAVPGDSLFYAPAKRRTNSSTSQGINSLIDTDSLYRLEVNFAGQITKKIEFVRAYRTINVYIKGLSTSRISPSVEIRDISTYYNFSYNTIVSQKKAFTRSTQTTDMESEKLSVAHFYTIYENITNNIKITVIDTKTDQTLASKNLLSYIQEYNLENLDDIDILFEFAEDGTLVKITLPNWDTVIVDPIY